MSEAARFPVVVSKVISPVHFAKRFTLRWQPESAHALRIFFVEEFNIFTEPRLFLE